MKLALFEKTGSKSKFMIPQGNRNIASRQFKNGQRIQVAREKGFCISPFRKTYLLLFSKIITKRQKAELRKQIQE